jgi:predicted dehydrogenase
MGGEMLGAASRHWDVVAAIAADIDDRAVELHRRAYPGVAYTTNPREVIDSTEIDALYIATPPAHHAELAIAGLRRGLAVFCEKPLAVSLVDGQDMLAAAAASGVPSFVNYVLADRHAALEVERALRAGEVGQVVGVDIRLHFSQWPRAFQADARWLAGRRQGGFLREVFSHFVYLTDRLLGSIRPVEVSVDYVAGEMGAEVAARGLLRAGDVPVHLSALSGLAAFSTSGGERCEWIMWGTRRSYLLRNWGQLFASDGGDWVPVSLPGERGSESTRLSRFAAAVRGEPISHLADFAAAYRVQEVVEAFHTTAIG